MNTNNEFFKINCGNFNISEVSSSFITCKASSAHASPVISSDLPNLLCLSSLPKNFDYFFFWF